MTSLLIGRRCFDARLGAAHTSIAGAPALALGKGRGCCPGWGRTSWQVVYVGAQTPEGWRGPCRATTWLCHQLSPPGWGPVGLSLAPSPKQCAMLIHALPWPQLLALVGIRKGLERVFSLHDLSWLDSLLPETAGKEAEGKQPRKRKEEESNGEEVGDALGATLFHSRPQGRFGAGAEPGLS